MRNLMINPKMELQLEPNDKKISQLDCLVNVSNGDPVDGKLNRTLVQMNQTLK